MSNIYMQNVKRTFLLAGVSDYQWQLVDTDRMTIDIYDLTLLQFDWQAEDVRAGQRDLVDQWQEGTRAESERVRALEEEVGATQRHMDHMERSQGQMFGECQDRIFVASR